MRLLTLSISLLLVIVPNIAFAASDSSFILEGVMKSKGSIFALIVFILSYSLVMAEEFIHLRKSKPVIIAAGIIWIIVAWIAQQKGADASNLVNSAIKHNILEYAELFLFLLVAMTYVNTMEERNIFEALRCYLISRKYSLRKLFIITGVLAFFISPVADNLTTSLIMCAVIMAVGKGNKKFITLGCINIVVSANAGGAFSPFGDITTLMVWQKGLVEFHEFFVLFFPAAISYIIPAAIMYFTIPDEQPKASVEKIKMKQGAMRIVLLFLLTIATAVLFHNYLHLPPASGMMLGLGFLKVFGYYLKIQDKKAIAKSNDPSSIGEFDVFKKVQRAEWDTLLFFYGVILCVGGLSTLGYLEAVSSSLYLNLGSSLSTMHAQTPANVLVGILSAIVDNIPVMFAVLTMLPHMSEGQWLLVTLTAGIGGSMLSIGSAAGVALMGQTKGLYTFFGHLKWTWAIMLGYFAGIVVHIYLNQKLFHVFI